MLGLGRSVLNAVKLPLQYLDKVGAIFLLRSCGLSSQ